MASEDEVGSQSGLARRGLLVGLGLSVSGCGFHPLYGARNGNGTVSLQQHDLGLIDVPVIPERGRSVVAAALQQRLASPTEALAKHYQLSVSFGITADLIAVQQDTTVTRLRETGAATWTLKMLDPSNTVVTSGTARSVDGLNIIDQEYFEADLAGETVQRRIAEAVADRITIQLASYFARHPATT